MRDRCISLGLVLLLLHIYRLLRGTRIRFLTVVEVELMMPDNVLHHGCSVARLGEGLHSEQVSVTHDGRFMGHGTATVFDPETIMTALQGVHVMLGEALGGQLGPFGAIKLLRHACRRWRLLLLLLIFINRL